MNSVTLKPQPGEAIQPVILYCLSSFYRLFGLLLHQIHRSGSRRLPKATLCQNCMNSRLLSEVRMAGVKMSLLKGIPDLNRKHSQHSSRTNRFATHTRFAGVSLDSWAHLSSTHDFVAKYLQNLQNSKRINPSLWCKGFNQRAYRL